MTKNNNFILHKSYGYLSQFINNQNKRKNKKLLGSLYDFPEGIMAIGRLDEDSEGLLLLTDDGVLSHKIRKKSVEKEYYVLVDGVVDENALKKLSEGVEISVYGKKYFTKPTNAHHISTPNFPERSKKIRDARHGPTSWLSITITEGKFRQVRKMTAAVGLPTLRLVRVRIGNIFLNDFVPNKIIQNFDDFKDALQTHSCNE